MTREHDAHAALAARAGIKVTPEERAIERDHAAAEAEREVAERIARERRLNRFSFA